MSERKGSRVAKMYEFFKGDVDEVQYMKDFAGFIKKNTIAILKGDKRKLKVLGKAAATLVPYVGDYIALSGMSKEDRVLGTATMGSLRASSLALFGFPGNTVLYGITTTAEELRYVDEL